MRIVALDVGSSSVRAIAYDEDGEPEPGDAHLAVRRRTIADELVEACRAVLAQVGEGDALAISCFWHSLLPLDERERPLSPLLTWRDVTGDPPALDPEAYHRAHRLLPASVVLAGEARRARRERATSRSPTICCCG